MAHLTCVKTRAGLDHNAWKAVVAHQVQTPGTETSNAQYWRSLAPEDLVGMIEALPDGVVVIGPDWRFRYANAAAVRLLRWPRKELLGAHLWSQFPDAVGEPVHLALEEAARLQRATFRTDYYAPFNGWFESRIFPHGDDLVIMFRDVTELHNQQQRLREYAERMAEAEQIANFGVWRWNIAAGTVNWSDELHRIYGLEPGTFEGTVDGFVARLHPDERERIWENISRSIETCEPFAFEERIIRADGAERMLLSQGRVIVGPGGRAAALVGVCHDVTDRALAERALGLSERRMRAIIDNTPSVVAVKDLDGRYLMTNVETGKLLEVNPDELIGHECAELFPDDIAQQLRANDRRAAAESEPVYDEVILMRDGEPRTFVTITFALPDEAGRPIETCTIGTDMTERRERESERRERLEWEARIHSALDEDRMVVYGQPVVDAASGELTSQELLVRMHDEDGGLLLPGAFLPAAERFGLIQSIDCWMVRQAMQLAPHIRPEVNLSAVTMCDPAARQQILEVLRASPEAAKQTVFEITETAAAEHLGHARAFADELTDLGCGLALDDFGTGFGSFTYLRTLPLRYLKIDLSFVRNLVHSVDDRRVVQSIVAIAEQFGQKTIAEGVEDEQTLALLGELGVDYAQGFHVGRPTPVWPSLS